MKKKLKKNNSFFYCKKKELEFVNIVYNIKIE